MSRPPTNHPYQDVFEVTFENVGSMVSRAEAYLHDCGIEESIAAICMLALSEAFNNVVEHSYEGRADGRAELHIFVCEEKILFQIVDWGVPPPENIFYDLGPMPDPESLPEGGWGLALIDTVMDRMEYHFDDGANHLKLVKKI